MSLNLTTIALAIFVLCAGFVLLRGIVRFLLGCLVLGVSVWVGLRLWQLAPDLVKACVGNHLEWVAPVLAIVGFVLTFIIFHSLVQFLTSPFRRSTQQRPPLTLARCFGVMFFALISTCLIVALLAIIVNDPDLQNLARNGHFTDLLRSPLVTKFLSDPKIQDLLKTFQH